MDELQQETDFSEKYHCQSRWVTFCGGKNQLSEFLGRHHPVDVYCVSLVRYFVHISVGGFLVPSSVSSNFVMIAPGERCR